MESRKAALDAPLEFEKVSAKAPPSQPLSASRQSSSPVLADAMDTDILADATATWFCELPANLRPLELGRRYRRIANKICALWKRPEACQDYFAQVLDPANTDAKLSPKAVGELKALQQYHATQFADRDGAGAEQLHQTTIAWVNQLPDHVRPLALAEQFPRIANKLCELWKRPTLCDPYLKGLVMDQRGGRKGFPLAVASELTQLREHYARVYPETRGLTDGDFMR